MQIGCHVSIAGGIINASQRAAVLGCEVRHIFPRSPQGGKAPILTPEICTEFKLQAKSYKLQATFVHTPYYINFASANNRIRFGSASVVRDELERASLIGAKFVMTHLGTAKDLGKEEARKKTIEMLKKTLEGYGGSAKLLLENSAGAGSIIGDDLAELGEIIKGISDENIAGICLDTQHSFASGYDWRDFNEKTGCNLSLLQRIDKELGLKNIKLIHANDSLTECNSKKDRHAHIGEGQIGRDAFQKIVAFAEKNNIDMILETEHDKVVEDIKLLKSFRKK